MGRATFVCKGLLFRAVHVTGERRRRKARAVILSTVQLAGLEGSNPR